MKSYFLSFLDLFFPKTCIYSGDMIPSEAEIPISYASEALLVNASRENLLNPEMENKFDGLFQYKFLFSNFIFSEGGVCQKLVHEAKYRGQTNIFEYYARGMALEIQGDIEKAVPDVIVPVPNHWLKKLKKGYNQAEVLSKTLSVQLDIKQESHVLKKRLDVSSQTQNSKLKRLNRLSNLYKTRKGKTVMGKHVLLVDDVVTSGATIETCVRHLYKSGASQVSVYCFAVVK